MAAIKLTYDTVIRIPELPSFTRQRVFTLAGYCAKNGLDINVVRAKPVQQGEPEIALCAEAMVIDGMAKPEVLVLHIGDQVEIEGRLFTIARPKWGSDARLVPA